ncbi:aminopeptidase N [Nocardioides sp.]|uniref:aminopeptidase N n=1 Tax=Nocardioides sp. TaxID=35761 RepID=UPI003514D4A3
MSVSSARSLLRSEAVARAALLRLESYDLDLDLAGDARTFGSRTVIRLHSAGGRTFLDVKPVALHAVHLDGVALDVGLLDGGRFPLDLPEGEHEVRVHATMPFRRDGEGLHRSTDPADGRDYVYGMSFMDAAPTVFACFDQPDLKAPYTVRVTAPPDWVVVGNAPARELGEGRWEIGPTAPLSTYFTTLVAGPYHVLREEHDGIGLGLSARRSLAAALDADAEELFTLTRQCFDEMHRLFGIRYPFGDYHQAFVPEFNAGAMENPGCVTFRDTLVFQSRVTRGLRIQRATTVAHEMAHQWFGNLTTPRWWDDLWLNESFAEYLGKRVTADVTRYDDAWTHDSWDRRQWGLRADQRPSTHPVAGNGAEDAVSALQNFDGISYAKGSSILKQWCAAMGDEVFFAGARDHFTRHRFGNATLADLVDSWTRAGATTLPDLVGPWLLQAGVDELRHDRAAGVLRLVGPDGAPSPRRHALDVDVREDGGEDGGGWSRTAVDLDGPTAALAAAPEAAVVLDPQERTWVVAVPDAATMAALPAVVAAGPDARRLAAIWNNIRSGYAAGEVAPAEVLAVAEAAFPVADTEDTPRRTLGWLLGEVAPLVPDALPRLHAAARVALADADPGSEEQLSAFRAAIRTGTDAAVLRAWQEAPPPGLEVDLDLRWRLLVRRADLGDVDLADLDAALAAEPATVAQVSHARARAGLPDAAAKAWAWDCFTGAVEVSNYELTAAGGGLWSAGLTDLTRPYLARYVADLPGTSAVRSGWVLADAADAFFPGAARHPDDVAALRGLLAPGVVEPAVARRVADRLDDLDRVLRTRDRFPDGRRA